MWLQDLGVGRVFEKFNLSLIESGPLVKRGSKSHMAVRSEKNHNT